MKTVLHQFQPDGKSSCLEQQPHTFVWGIQGLKSTKGSYQRAPSGSLGDGMQEGIRWTTGAGVIGLNQSALLVRRGEKPRPKEARLQPGPAGRQKKQNQHHSEGLAQCSLWGLRCRSGGVCTVPALTLGSLEPSWGSGRWIQMHSLGGTDLAGAEMSVEGLTAAWQSQGRVAW